MPHLYPASRGPLVMAVPVLLVLGTILVTGCGTKKNAIASPNGSSGIVGTWLGTMDLGAEVPTVYVFSPNGTETVMTQNPHGMMSVSGTYTLNGDNLTLEQTTMTGLGQHTSIYSTSTQKIEMSATTLRLPNNRVSLTRQPGGAPLPAWATASAAPLTPAPTSGYITTPYQATRFNGPGTTGQNPTPQAGTPGQRP